MIQRLSQGTVVLFGLTVLVFLMTKLVPGDPVLVYVGEPYEQEVYDAVYKMWGLDKPLIEQYWDFLTKAVRLDFGESYFKRQPVMDIIGDRFPNTLRIAVFAFLLANLFGITVGTLAAVFRGKWIDSFLMTFEVIFISAPNFWMALIFQLIFGLYLGVLPISGLESWKHYILPVLTIGMRLSASISRFTRTAMLEVVRQDYVRTARAKGLNEFVVIAKHAFRNALIPIITISAMQFGSLLSGSMLVENVFTIPGLGQLSLDAFQQRDRPLLAGTVLYTGAIITLMNLLADVLYSVIDPRIRVDGKRR